MGPAPFSPEVWRLEHTKRLDSGRLGALLLHSRVAGSPAGRLMERTAPGLEVCKALCLAASEEAF